MKRSASLLILAAVCGSLLLIELNSHSSNLPEANKCAQINWLTNAATFHHAWPYFHKLHAASNCTQLNIVLVGASRAEEAQIAEEIRRPSSPFSQIVVEASRTVSEAHSLDRFNDGHQQYSVVLVSTSPFCIGPSLLVVLEQMHGISSTIASDLCNNQFPRVFLLGMSLLRDSLDRHPMTSLEALADHLNTTKVESFQPFSNPDAVRLAQCGKSICEFPDFRELDHVVDFPRPTAKRLPTKHKKCTMILTIFDRFAFARERIEFYETLSVISKIFVVWNNVEQEPPTFSADSFRLPVFISRQEVNSMNNRFKPHPFIDTDCVIMMDDDWHMPHTLIEFSAFLWRQSFTEGIVGLWKLARLHGVDEEGKWVYMYNNTMPQSILLPSGMVFHTKYLEMYTTKLPESTRKLVDYLTNCDDLLFNFMIANVTKRAPVFVDHGPMSGVRAKSSSQTGLWSRRAHLLDRHRCLQEFNALFGNNTLKYTTTKFDVRRKPQASQHLSLDISQVQCRKCGGPAIDDCVTCRISN